MTEQAKTTQQGLGKGLSALFSDTHISRDGGDDAARIHDIPLGDISPGDSQPRTRFDEEKIRELADSIKENGLLQPVTVYKTEDGKYKLIAGERRWRACKLLGVNSVQAIIRGADNARLAELAIIENIQREDLSVIEEAAAYKRLQQEYEYTQETLAKRLGKSRAHVANLIRLLNLPEDVLALVNDGKISGGHARALLAAENPSLLADTVIERGLSVRETEKLVKQEAGGGAAEAAAKRAIKRTLAQTPQNPPAEGADFSDSENEDIIAIKAALSEALNLKVRVSYDETEDSGVVKIAFSSMEELDVIMRAAHAYSAESGDAAEVDEAFDNVHSEEMF